MTKNQKAKEVFKKEIEEKTGIEPDRWGNFKFTITRNGHDKKYRVQVKKTVWRLEIKVATSWTKLAGGKFNFNEAVYLSQRINEAVKANG